MRPSFRPAAVALVVVAALSVSGCAPPSPAKPPTSSPSSTALFASDEEALAAAEEAYAEYVSVTDQVFQEGGQGVERLAAVARGRQLTEDEAGFEDVSKSGYRSTGHTEFDSTKLQRNSMTKSGVAEVVVYLCQDISSVDVVDTAGNSVVLESRPDRIRYEVTLVSDANADAPRLFVSNRVPWNESAC